MRRSTVASSIKTRIRKSLGEAGLNACHLARAPATGDAGPQPSWPPVDHYASAARRVPMLPLAGDIQSTSRGSMEGKFTGGRKRKSGEVQPAIVRGAEIEGNWFADDVGIVSRSDAGKLQSTTTRTELPSRARRQAAEIVKQMLLISPDSPDNGNDACHSVAPVHPPRAYRSSHRCTIC